MKLIARIKLNPTPEQNEWLLQTLTAANRLCNWISQQAWRQQQFRRYPLHHAVYHTARQETGLAAQLVERCIAKVADSYRQDQDRPHSFKPQGAIAYDDRILSWETDNQAVSLWTVQGRQARFQRNTNHVISKRLVAKAERTNRAIALEELTGIRARTRVKGKSPRARRSNWSFAQLRDFVTYKARRVGAPVKMVNPAYTSQRCFVCGQIDRANRRSQAEFLCCACGHTDHADVNAAKNIAWAAFNQPDVGKSGSSAFDLQAAGLVPAVR